MPVEGAAGSADEEVGDPVPLMSPAAAAAEPSASSVAAPSMR
jgi:hypothetical protein